MANYLLIDTCILKKLVSKIEFSPDLRWIEIFINENNFVLIVPEALKNEWFDKHRAEELKNINSAMSGHRRSEKLSKLYNLEDSVFENKKSHAERVLISQIELIDELLKKGIQIVPNPTVKGIVYDHRSKKLAPFKNNDESFNDASMIFSSLEFVNGLTGENILYFISANTKDFGFHNGVTLVIHPEIKAEYPEVKIRYYTEIFKLRNELDPRDPVNDSNRSTLHDWIEIIRDRPLIDQVLEYLEIRFKEIKFLPKQLFVNQYPFVESAGNSYYSRPFTISTDNQDLFQLFQDQNPDPGFQSKRENISHILYQNHVRFISDERENRLEIRGLPIKSTALRHAFESLDFRNLINLIQKQSNNPFEKAYYSYKLGLFNESAYQMQDAIESTNNNNPTMTFIGWFNLDRLKRFIDNNLYQEPDIPLINKLNDLKIDVKLKENSHETNREILRYINDRTFFSKTSETLQESLKGIRDDFYTQCGGFHTHTGRLLDNFSILESFLVVNFIVYDYFSEFSGIMESFTEGMFASYACSSRLVGRLLHFDDYSLNKIILHGDSAFIKKCASRYALDSLKYEVSGNPGDSFIDWAFAILTEYQDVLDLYHQLPGAAPRFFKDRYQKLVANIITLSALLSLNPDSSNKLTALILSFTGKQDFIFKQFMIDHVLYYLSKKHTEMSQEFLIEFFLLGIQNSSYHSSLYIMDVGFYLDKRGIKIELQETDENLIITEFVTECARCNTHHSLDMLGMVFSRLKPSEFKVSISENLSALVSDSFDAEDYANAILFDIVKPTAVGNEAYFKYIEMILNQGKIKRFNPDEDFYTDHRIDYFLNCWFKFDLSIPEHIFLGIRELGTYYQWLISPDDFDYSLFSENWPSYYFTKYYKWHFRKSRVLQLFVLNNLTNKFNKNLARFYIATYDMEN